MRWNYYTVRIHTKLQNTRGPMVLLTEPTSTTIIFSPTNADWLILLHKSTLSTGEERNVYIRINWNHARYYILTLTHILFTKIQRSKMNEFSLSWIPMSCNTDTAYRGSVKRKTENTFQFVFWHNRQHT